MEMLRQLGVVLLERIWGVGVGMRVRVGMGMGMGMGMGIGVGKVGRRLWRGG